MPELPDLEHVVCRVRAAVVGRKVAQVRIGDPLVLRIMIAGAGLPELVVGMQLRALERRGHFLRFDLGPKVALIINAMLVGRYRLLPPPGSAPPRKDPASLMFALGFDDGRELQYLDDKRMGKVYVVTPADEDKVPIYNTLGVDPISGAFTPEHFSALLAGRRDQVRNFLLDKLAIASIGNAYADEILFAARLHPKTFCGKLAPADINRLYQAVGDVLRAAIAEIARRDPPIDEKVRDFLAVRGRDRQPCRICGTTIRTVRVGAGDACFCPSCQPATRALFIDWTKAKAKKPPPV